VEIDFHLPTLTAVTPIRDLNHFYLENGGFKSRPLSFTDRFSVLSLFRPLAPVVGTGSNKDPSEFLHRVEESGQKNEKVDQTLVMAKLSKLVENIVKGLDGDD
jgi:hypothetical protein